MTTQIPAEFGTFGSTPRARLSGRTHLYKGSTTSLSETIVFAWKRGLRIVCATAGGYAAGNAMPPFGQSYFELEPETRCVYKRN